MWKKNRAGIEIGTRGPEKGEILKDEIHSCDARIILEKDCKHAKYAITFEINGFFVHTSFISYYSNAIRKYNEIKKDINDILTNTQISEVKIFDWINSYEKENYL